MPQNKRAVEMTKRDMMKEYEAAGFTRDEYAIARRLANCGIDRFDGALKLASVKYMAYDKAIELVDMVRFHLCREAE